MLITENLLPIYQKSEQRIISQPYQEGALNEHDAILTLHLPSPVKQHTRNDLRCIATEWRPYIS